MKKIMLIIITILLLAGCSKTVDTVPPPPIDVPNPTGYMTEPQILLSSEHRYKEESWLSEDIELKDSSIVLQGDSFFATIIFQGSISEEKLRAAVKVEGYTGEQEVSITPSEGKTVFYGSYRNLEKNKPYKLLISKDIVDAEGKTLKADIQKEITLKADTTALYSLITSEGSYYGLGWHSIFDIYAVANMNLSPDSKTFIVDFSAEVNTASVEQSITQNLSNDAKCTFQWNNPKKLTLKIENLEGEGATPYVVSMMSAKDSEGNPIYGDLYFVTDQANKLGSIDIMTKKDSVLYNFPDKRYDIVQSGKISNTIILEDAVTKYIFNMTTKKREKIDVSGEYFAGIPNINLIYSWLDSDRIVLLNKADGKIISYSTKDGSSKEMFVLPAEIVKNYIFEISASADGSKLAIAYETLPPGDYSEHDFIINVFDIKGNSLYKGVNLFMPRFLELFGSTANIKWLDSDTLVLEDNLFANDKQDYNVISINTKTGEKSLIAEHSFRPVVFQGKDLIKVESFKEFGVGERSIDIIKSGKKIKSFKAGSFLYDNFHFFDENTLVYNENNKIFVYYIDKGKSVQIGNGYIIGLSEDGSKVYYMTNHKMLHYLD
jgi:hypothetical protein